MNSAQVLLKFGTYRQPVRFTNCADLLAPLTSILVGWDPTPVAPDRAARAVIRITKTADGYRRVSCWQHTRALARSKTRPTQVEAICGFHFELIDWYLAEHRMQVPLHGAGLCFGEQVVLFPALARAGKSTLAAHLAMAGHRLFSDDVMPIDCTTREAVAMGIQPRLRQIPPDASDEFLAFVAARTGPARPSRIYVLLKPSEIAPVGTRAPVGGIVLLERDDKSKPTLEPADRADVLEKLILQNFSTQIPAADALDALHATVAGARCFHLSYARAPEAVALLESVFGGAK